MNKMSIKEILEATGGTLLHKGSENYITGIEQDSRKCGSGDMFTAIIGENHDGHDYIRQVLDSGCGTILVSRDISVQGAAGAQDIGGYDVNVILVDDTVHALGQLASYYLDTLNVKKVAVTGSVGKTSVRDMIYYILSEKYNCGRNMKNYNNFIGLPFSVFQFDSDTEVVVLEMGMDRFGEIDRLSEIVKPHIGVITNIGIAHIERLGSREGIFRAKMELVNHLGEGSEDRAALVFAYDDEMLTRESTKGNYDQIAIGENGKSDYIISSVDDFGIEGIQFTLEHLEESRRISLPVPGYHNAANASLAIAVGNLLGVTTEEAVKGLAKTELTGSRLRQTGNGKIKIIDDTYNATPDSVKSALKVLENSPGKRKIAILGDMYELGSERDRQHFNIGVFTRMLEIDWVVAVGEAAKNIADGAAGGTAQVAWFEKKEDFYREVDRFAEIGDIILIKGSRGMKMEQIVEKLLEQ
ncbi:MAG: UDP-N-acetylmuramoyl-tripeptide--D-alanyl-D-alanine ligase [Bacillota bacterium]|nr:UDP-N-acetylmuramoyl-tripeptide--D-alanyl-D-alanine ligase [Bacillota bacterium]